MSTRTRIVLTYQNRFLCSGPTAIQELLYRVYPHLHSVKRKLKDQLGGSKREKLKQLAQKLPPDFALILIQEPRGTQKSRSLYWKYRVNQAVPRQQAGGIAY